jgi:hypothetical protein
MIEHLSAEQISQWMIGERTLELERHLAQCTACRSELEQMEQALWQFRAAMRNPVDIPAPVWREPAPRPWFSWQRLVLAAATLLILVGLPTGWIVRQQERAAAAAALADSQLLEQVDSEISQAVPEPLEPLVTLVTWNSSAADQDQKVQGQPK